LTGYVKDHKASKSSSEITIAEFVSYTKNKVALEKELKRMGWHLVGGESNQA